MSGERICRKLVSKMYCVVAKLLVLALLAVASFGEEECESGAIDLVFVVDDSGSIEESDFQIALEAAVTLVDSLKVGNTKADSRVGFVVFDTDPRLGFYLDRYTTNAQVDAAIMATTYLGESTDIAAGMNYALLKIFDYDESLHGKRGVPRIMLLLTDGDDSSDVAAQHALAVQRGVTTYAIGIGSGVDVLELTNATGDSKNVFLASDFAALKNVINQVCHTIEASVAPPAPVHKQGKSCGCEPETVGDARFWLDIIFVIDSSDGVSSDDFQTIKSFLVMMTNLNLKQAGSKDPQYSRMAIINTAEQATDFLNLTTTLSSAQISSHISKDLTQKGGYRFDVQGGLERAYDMIMEEKAAGRRENVRKAVVLFSTASIDCRKQTLRANPNETDVLCQLVAVLEDDSTTLISVALKLAGSEEYPYIDIVNKCNALENSHDMVPDVLKSLCQANCYCLEPYTQFAIGEDGCQKFGECVHADILSLPYPTAKLACADQGVVDTENVTLSTSYSKEKDEFLQELHLAAGFFPFWIGMTCPDGVCIGDDGTPLAQTNFTKWCTEKSQPNFAVGNCVYEDQCKTFETGWFSAKCGNFMPANYFSCQANACSVNHYCEYLNNSPKTSSRKATKNRRGLFRNKLPHRL